MTTSEMRKIISDNTCVFCGSLTNEDLRKWFGKGPTGTASGGGWDRYGSDGQKLGKCGDGKEGGAYAACLSKEKAAKLGPKGRASFVRRKRKDQKKAGDSKKGRQKSKGKKPVYSKTKTEAFLRAIVKQSLKEVTDEKRQILPRTNKTEIFKNVDADKYLQELVDLLGKPSYKSEKEWGWHRPNIPETYGKYMMKVRKVDKVYIMDESIPHSFPKDHRDFVYTTYSVPEWKPKDGKHTIDVELFKQFAGVTGSIIIDGLKGTVTARCGDLVANDITINFVLDVVKGKVKPNKEEYAKRILGDK